MAKPSSRQELIDYCLRQLGEPVLEINVDDDQIEDAVDVNNLGWRQRHFETLVTSPQNPDFQLED